MENEKAKPVSEVKFGSIVASVWKNESKNGVYFNVTISRVYKDGEDNWKRSESFGREDLLTVAKVADLAHTRIFELSKESKE